MTATRIDRILGFEHGLPPTYAAAAALIGLGFLVFGWRLHRVTVIVSGFLIGAFAGSLVSKWIQVEKAWGVFVGGTAMALLADPLSRLVIFFLSGLAVGLGLGEGVRVLFSSKGFAWGFFPGFLLGGSLSIWQMRTLVILSTAFLGALALCWGSIVALGAWVNPGMVSFHVRHPVGSLLVLGLLFLIGVVVQFRFSPRQHRNGGVNGAVPIQEN